MTTLNNLTEMEEGRSLTKPVQPDQSGTSSEATDLLLLRDRLMYQSSLGADEAEGYTSLPSSREDDKQAGRAPGPHACAGFDWSPVVVL